MRRIIGLTGGIATGKSTVSDYLKKKYNLLVLDADIYAKEAVKIGSPILEDIFGYFGKDLCLQDGSLDRLALGNIVFSDSEAKTWLEAKIHPYVRDRFSQELAHSNEDVIVLAIPLLFEANLTHLVTEIWVVSCNGANQLQRLQKRNGFSLEQAQQRIKSQLPLSEKEKKADFILNNNSTLEELYRQCDFSINIPPQKESNCN